jgi:hypothetical protein
MTSGHSDTKPTADELGSAVVNALAEVRAMDAADLQSELGLNGGDLGMESVEAEAVLAMLQVTFGRPLAKPEDLEPEQMLTTGAIADLISRRW